ncbi:hypothetical protein Tco_1310445 [Tanacetum coccineum]
MTLITLRDQFLYDKLTKDDQEKSKVIEESDSTIPDPSHQTVTSTPPVIAPFTDVSSTKPSSLLRVARLEQEMSEVKKTDHSADVLASIKSQVPTSIKNHSNLKESKGDYPESNREQGKRKQDSTYPAGQQTRVALEEFDLKIKVKDHKRKHDNDDEEDDDDDEGPSDGSNQGRSLTQKRSSNSSKKLKGIHTLTPAEQEAADIMKALKESKKMSKRQPGTGGLNEGIGNILGVPDESTVISRASSEGTGSKPGVPDEEKLFFSGKDVVSVTFSTSFLYPDRFHNFLGSLWSVRSPCGRRPC